MYLYQSPDWSKIRSGRGILIYSAGQGLNILNSYELFCCFFVVIISMSVSIHNFLLLISFLETIPLLKDFPMIHYSYCCMIVMTKSKPSLQSLSLKFSKPWYACCSHLSKLSCTKPHHPPPPFLQVDFLSGTFGFMVLNRICGVVE